jgi:hypothetical protein
MIFSNCSLRHLWASSNGAPWQSPYFQNQSLDMLSVSDETSELLISPGKTMTTNAGSKVPNRKFIGLYNQTKVSIPTGGKIIAKILRKTRQSTWLTILEILGTFVFSQTFELSC